MIVVLVAGSALAGDLDATARARLQGDKVAYGSKNYFQLFDPYVGAKRPGRRLFSGCS